MPKSSLCLRVPRVQGQTAIEVADKLGLRAKQLQVQNDDNFVCVPLNRQLNEKEVNIFKKQAVNIQLETRIFTEREQDKKTLESILANVLPSHLLTNLPHALDIIGDIAIVEVPSELKPYEKLVGGAILKTHRNVKTVVAKAGAISGIYRTRELAFLAGEPKTCTIHRELGCQYYVDVAKAYFSPRLSHEHQRVALLVKKNEVVLDLFAGVGPFSILIAKTIDSKIYAIDINPEAFALLKKNILLNRVQNCVMPILGNARQIMCARFVNIADRVIMNLPESAIDFIDVACTALKLSGGTIHFYSFIRQPATFNALESLFEKAVERAGRKVEQFLCARVVRETAPYQQQVVLDAKII